MLTIYDRELAMTLKAEIRAAGRRAAGLDPLEIKDERKVT